METREQPVVSIVLVNFRTPAMTLECVKSLASHCRAIPSEIIVVDNGSGDNSVECLRDSPVPLVLVPLPVNIGFGGGCNAGARVAKGEYIYLLNNDTLMEEDSVRALVDFLKDTPSAVAVGSGLCCLDKTPQLAAFNFPTPLRILVGARNIGPAIERRFPSLRNRLSLFIPPERLTAPCRVDWCVGASLMIRASAYRETGGFDEDFFLYSEEVDLCRRLLPFGEIWFNPKTVVIHLEGASLKEGEISERRLGYIAAGRRLYYRKHNSFLGSCLCNLADAGGGLAKAVVLWLATLGGRNPAGRHRARELFAYVRNYFRYSYPLSPNRTDGKS